MATKKYVLIDTNVLLDDPKALLKFKDTTILMPVAVIKELDNIKKGYGSIHRNSREVSRILEKIRVNSLKSKKGNIIFLAKNKYDSSLPVDDILIEIAKKYKAKLISNDLNVRVAAFCEGVKTEPYLIPNIKNRDKVYKGFSRIKKEFTNKSNKAFSARPNHYYIYKEPKKRTKIYKKRSGQLISLKNTSYKNIEGITALNFYQKMAMDALMDPSISLVCLDGSAGTGKTLLALACSIAQVKQNTYQSLSVGRTIIPVGKDLGALPGNVDEKVKPYLAPIFDNLDILAQENNDPFNQKYTETLQSKNLLSIQPISLLRGRTLNRKVFIIDEAQNLTLHEASTIITRAGKGTKIIMIGDPNQIDKVGLDKYNNGLSFIKNAFIGQKCFANITLEKVERSELAELAVKILKI